jgi:hypothetical protein
MLFVNLVIAFVAAFVVWYAASRLLAQFIVATETRNPRNAARPAWNAAATAATFGVFLFSVAFWLGLTYLLERLSR